MINVGIAGVSGYTGVELAKLISSHPKAKLCAVTSNSYKGKSLTNIFPSMRGFENLICEDLDIQSLSKKVDLMFLALPHKISMQHVPALLEQKIKVIDLSADYRFTDAKAYESAYQEHTSKHLLKQSVYGLSEIYRDQIKAANLVGNPGCYPTSILLPLLPLLNNGLIRPDGIISDSKSGVSGAGRSLSLSTHFCEANESFTAYKVGNHRHTPEINEILSIHSQQKVSITFVPHLLPLTRGMLSTIYAQATEKATEDKIRQALNTYYEKQCFVRILGNGMYPAISYVKGTNCCDIGFHFDEKTKKIIIISAIDNILKGAAGQAVQNMNIMFGLNEETGLNSFQGPL
ncbi:MAG: N-acetyl-gamma-glutamyl-phosphate reductase [Desulfobacula sp.]|uniref:N-acetyl-gamma-glutamyl-phosphate reductase n=1 Tax=Desulfobacula sp. TaxID=2593537 RepID=UPI001D5446F8|nr:N-acetyl-gamma-glutamyl-phosphate reductase [Desulfobacula sp.]MBT3484117.1 N-acetyl-gamma-glutamyl-phosphate reductase [Desulfobacula sp.]MBT3803770.1 N-acetyl-gamma-glutamyl-phosphate reductase [Desulfobacula sp.]MBT4024475.1 N-acetyl-gamma-glutamyl-phosphate reductase [Desulfobacula sp.]MBT4198516.1 N-acetyl-gamma-glutamyl-phosphate reductase [Desulfobacula sp.]